MALNTHFQVKFATFKGEKLTVSIKEEGYTGSIVQLTGAEDPLVTQENADKDVFKTVRGQTGHLKIVTDSLTLMEQMMPSHSAEKVVHVTNASGTLLWAGFLTCNSYSQPYDVGLHKISIPVVSTLGVMSNVTISSATPFQQVSIRDLLQDIFSTMPGIEYIAFTTALNDIDDWLDTTVFTSPFYTLKEDDSADDQPTHAYYEGKPMADVLDIICKPMGFVVREFGDTINILDLHANDVDSYTTLIYEVQSMQLEDTDTRTGCAITDLEPFIIGNNPKVSYNGGKRSVTVNLSLSSENPLEFNMPTTPFSSENPMYHQIPNSISDPYVEKDAHFYLQVQPLVNQRSTLYKEAFPNMFYAYIEYEQYLPDEFRLLSYSWHDIDLTAVKTQCCMNHDLTGWEGHEVRDPWYYCYSGAGPCRFLLEKDIAGKTLESGTFFQGGGAAGRYIYNQEIPQQDEKTAEDTLIYSLESNYSIKLTSGTIRIDVDGYSCDWWQRGLKKLTTSPISVYIGNTPITNGMVVSNIISGPIKVKCYGSDFANNLDYIIKNIHIYIESGDISIQVKDTDKNSYYRHIADKFEKDENVSLEIGTVNNNRDSISLLRQTDGTLINNYAMNWGQGAVNVRPEKYLLERLYAHYQQNQRMLEHKYRMTLTDYQNTYLSQIGMIDDVRRVTQLAIVKSHDWRDSVIELMFMDFAPYSL